MKECHAVIDSDLSRVRRNAILLLEQLCHTPVLSINDVGELIGSTYKTAQKLVESFVDYKILQQIDDKQRNKAYRFYKYLDILEEEFAE